ncbi:YggT family protein [Companilactobacillus furfuricola]|uniref:YggT family protein n=1 Tax=Companilactobacillus furfuricola TaxID=1462575 RepID=UPI000F7A4DF7|nr:YggT family protein [Companilactobacillus furfuricola]
MTRVMAGLPLMIAYLFRMYEILIFVYCVLTFIPALYNSVIGRFVRSLVEPFLNLISRIIPTRIGMIDFSPIIALVLVQVLARVIFYIV